MLGRQCHSRRECGTGATRQHRLAGRVDLHHHNVICQPESLAELGAAINRRFPNEPLSSGEIISSGTLTAGHLTDKGDLWTAEVEGLPLPPLTLRLT